MENLDKHYVKESLGRQMKLGELEVRAHELRSRVRGTRVGEARVKELWAAELRPKESI